MAESSSSGDEEFKGEAKYKQFSAAVERALKGFELSSEWHDLISSLARLNKVCLTQSTAFLCVSVIYTQASTRIGMYSTL